MAETAGRPKVIGSCAGAERPLRMVVPVVERSSMAWRGLE